MPLHPMAVHFPIVFTILIALAIISAILFEKKINNQKIVWGAIVALSVALTVSSFITIQLAEIDEEVVEKIISETLIENHAELGELFAWSSILLLILASLVYYRDKLLFKGLALFASIVLLGLLVQTAHLGGELVYKHNAGAAFAQVGSDGKASQPSFSVDQGGNDKDDDD